MAAAAAVAAAAAAADACCTLRELSAPILREAVGFQRHLVLFCDQRGLERRHRGCGHGLEAPLHWPWQALKALLATLVPVDGLHRSFVLLIGDHRPGLLAFAARAHGAPDDLAQRAHHRTDVTLFVRFLPVTKESLLQNARSFSLLMIASIFLAASSSPRCSAALTRLFRCWNLYFLP